MGVYFFLDHLLENLKLGKGVFIKIIPEGSSPYGDKQDNTQGQGHQQNPEKREENLYIQTSQFHGISTNI
jgi:hypothetical protein